MGKRIAEMGKLPAGERTRQEGQRRLWYIEGINGVQAYGGNNEGPEPPADQEKGTAGRPGMKEREKGAKNEAYG